VIDIDQHGEPDEVLEQRNEKAAHDFFQMLAEFGGDPLLMKSNGRGGYHLWLIFDRAVSSKNLHALGKTIVQHWEKLEINEPEVFPKQPELKEGQLGNLMRLPGLHHTYEFHTQVWDGKTWLKGQQAIDRICAVRLCPGDLVFNSNFKIEEITSPPKTSLKPLQHSTTSSPELIVRARAYLAKMPPAISGQKGRNQFLNAACRMVDDFALGREEANKLLKDYNARCVPPFNDREFADKLDSALAKVAARGGPSGSKTGLAIAEPPCSGPCFVGYVPDFGLIHTGWVRGFCDKPLPLGEMIYRFSLWNRLHAHPLIPDLLIRQLVWGTRHDKNWRSRLAKKTKILGRLKTVKNKKICSAERCMLYGTAVAHRHYTASLTHYGCLESFRAKNDVNNIHANRFLLYADEHKERREQLQRNGALFNIYWPAFILGGSPKVGWSWAQQLLVVNLVRELTRVEAKSGKAITGAVVKGGMVAGTTAVSSPERCPILDRYQDYVVFGGNGRRKGRGYQIIGRTDKGWLHRSGYTLPEKDPSASETSEKRRRELMKTFLTDLAFLSNELGLVPVGLLNGVWRNIGQLMDCLKTGNGQDWLEACTMRVYAPADWQTRWRKYFSDKLGFGWIPVCPESCTLTAELGDASRFDSAHAIRKWLSDMNWSQKYLAERITAVTGCKCSLRRVERNLSDKGPSPDFQKDVLSVHAHNSDSKVT
jgi:hypothetical protein